MRSLLDVGTVRVPRACADEVHAHLAKVGRQGYEGLGLWAGTLDGDAFHVRKAIIPAQKHMRTKDGVCVAVGPNELHRVNVWLYEEGLTLVGQIHSHPSRAYHSDTDDAFAVATAAGCLSLVVPDFAVRPFELQRCAVFRLDGRGRWREVSARHARQLIRIED